MSVGVVPGDGALRERTPAGAAEAKALLDRLSAEPRPAGSAAEAAARDACAIELEALGFTVDRVPFDYSALPGRYATSLGGLLSIGALALAGQLGFRGHGPTALGVLTAVATAVGIGGWWLARRGVLDAPLMRRRGVNLVAQRGTPRLWLVAHLDSKSQPVPIAARAAGIALSVVAWCAALALAAAQSAGADAAGWWPWVSGAGVLAGLPVAASVVGARSAGALDNASGVATMLLAARRVARERPLGVLLTSAEELGLAGARAWARGAAPGVAVNCDGVDDAGTTTVMFTATPPERLVRELGRAAQGRGLVLRARRLLPGILVDGVALADAGWEVVTVSRGTLGTLARIHTAADTPARLTGMGIADVAALVADAAEQLA